MVRIAVARERYVALGNELDIFLYRYIEGMLVGWDDDGAYSVQLREPDASNVSGRPQVLTIEILEGSEQPWTIWFFNSRG